MELVKRLSLGSLRLSASTASSGRWSYSYSGGRMRRIKRVALGMSGGVDSTGTRDVLCTLTL